MEYRAAFHQFRFRPRKNKLDTVFRMQIFQGAVQNARWSNNAMMPQSVCINALNDEVSGDA